MRIMLSEVKAIIAEVVQIELDIALSTLQREVAKIGDQCNSLDAQIALLAVSVAISKTVLKLGEKDETG